MLADVLAACEASARGSRLRRDATSTAGATIVADEGRGQGAAVPRGSTPPRRRRASPFLVVNADLPCVTPRDLLALAGASPDDGLALVAAADGTTNALALSSPELFVPLYGPGSAARFAALAPVAPARRAEPDR